MSRLHRLALLALVGIAAGAGGEELPFELVGGVMLVKAAVTGNDFLPFLFDTGATESLLTPQAAAKAGLGGGVGKRITCTVSLGTQTTPGVSFLVFDPLQAISLRLDKGIDYAGILGYPFLPKFVFTIDYDRKLIDWQAPAPAGAVRKTSPGTTRVPFVLRDRLVHLPVSINGKKPLTFLLDTGSAEVLLLPRAADILGIRTGSANRADGIRFATADRIAVGNASVAGMAVVVHRLLREGIGALTYDGILGYPFLSHFKTTINYKEQVILLDPLESHQAARDDRQGLGR